MTIKAKITGGIATGAILAGIVLPAGAFASNHTVKISGNGKGSSNTVLSVNKNKQKTTQVNAAAVFNLTGTVLNTGKNSANGNTGSGSVSLSSGNASSRVTNNSTVGGNITTSDCGCDQGDMSVTIKGNGSGSSNTAVVVNKSKHKVTQFNGALIVNGTFTVENTGGNSANGNTGKGDVSLMSGNATSSVTNNTTVGGNVMQ